LPRPEKEDIGESDKYRKEKKVFSNKVPWLRSITMKGKSGGCPRRKGFGGYADEVGARL